MNSPRMKEAEIVDILRNSPKGQLRYDNGWDHNPQAIWQLVSNIQAEAEEPKIAIIERAMRVTTISELRNKHLRQENRGSAGTSSGSGSRLTLAAIDSDNNGRSNNHDQTDRNGRKSQGPGGDSKPIKTKRRGFGIREDEYDDDEMALDVELEILTELTDHLAFRLKEYDEEIKEKVSKEIKNRREIFDAGLKDCNAQGDILEQKLKRENSEKFKVFAELSKDDKILANIEADRTRRKQQEKQVALICEARLKETKEARKLATKYAEVEAARLAEIKETENRAAQIRLEQSAAEEERLRKHQEEETRKKNEALRIANEKLEAQKLLEQSSKEQGIPAALQGLILKEDCENYSRCTDLIQQYEMATEDIKAGSTNPNIKKFYSGASLCINTPLNAIALTEPHQIAVKTTHFINMIEGKPVYGRSSLAEPFTSSALPNGRLFVLRLLAFRIVKKAEAEILSEQKGFIPLATIGISLCKKFPELATLVQSYFYKLCPFLVPFSFPRGDKSLQEYCNSLGYELKGEEATLRNLLLARIKGYCSLYAIMVINIEKQGPYDLGDANLFFSIRGVWEILTKTMKLEPQPDVTIMVIQTLLELLTDRLQQVYGKQFLKAMNVLISVYLPKINNVSQGASKGGVNRFQTFLEQKFRRAGAR